ncbi:MAG: NADH-quinone oxidoreductase subunit N [Candidatus Ordinivivax streblomastigis]|uniref:NADH-quinone oxidoreductase subunit N n=1 Tax=Candidatus Ordinivivax streblomastigis TaxID=2540710 RepID=A0A5M8NTV4_9BACT|nr:MAG: NADH-quinone oxidoreductase subunit N [Candidatus Ordinivivax streblomastigis]
MDFSNFLYMGQEIGLVILFVFLFLYDTFCSEKGKKYFTGIAIALFAVLTAYGFCPAIQNGEAFGGMYISSPMTVFMKTILNVATLIIFLQANQWLASEGTVHRRGEFYTITLVTLLGMYLMVSAGNFMLLYIGMETASLPLACLAAYNKYKEKSAEAGVKYVLISALSSGIMLFGLSFLYGSLGSMYCDNMSIHIINESSPLVILGFIFFFSGLGFKLSLVPFHLWTADVYEGAPTSVTAYLSVVSKGAAAFALIFAIYKVFGTFDIVWKPILWWLAVITITLGNLFAIRQKDMKRFFAFSSISQAGYILLGIIAGTAQGMEATVFYVLVYLFSNLAAFGVISAIENQSKGDTRISAFNGLYNTNPKLAFVMMVAVFSLGGIPFLAGFFSKFFIFMAAAEQGQFVLVFIALLNTVISLYYYLLIVKAMFINEREEYAVEKFKTDGYNKLSLIICTVGIFIIGFLSCIYEHIGTFSFGL